jgi:hypothetical protein
MNTISIYLISKYVLTLWKTNIQIIQSDFEGFLDISLESMASLVFLISVACHQTSKEAFKVSITCSLAFSWFPCHWWRCKWTQVCYLLNSPAWKLNSQPVASLQSTYASFVLLRVWLYVRNFLMSNSMIHVSVSRHEWKHKIYRSMYNGLCLSVLYTFPHRCTYFDQI